MSVLQNGTAGRPDRDELTNRDNVEQSDMINYEAKWASARETNISSIPWSERTVKRHDQ